MTARLLEAAVRRYDWGSPTAIPRLLGKEPDGRPIAELWFGAHPDSPSAVAFEGATLDAVIERDPTTALGPRTVEHFGTRLPYLLKLLAADRPLSIQVHPNRAQAEDGYAREDTAGVARDASQRNYRDRNHKPELLCALTPFEALCGFRPAEQTLALLEMLRPAGVDFLAEALRRPDPLRAAFVAVLELAEPATAARRLADSVADDGPLRGVHLAARHYPGDVGVLLAVLLNHVRLAPGEAIFLGAGNVHAYLHGTGVEIMAASDNVLRCGLTGKHVDPAELLRITDFRPLDDPIWPRGDEGFTLPVPDFRLVPLAVREPTRVPVDGPRIVLCTHGTVEVGGAGESLTLTPGRAAFVPAADGECSVDGRGTVFVAAVGDQPVGTQ